MRRPRQSPRSSVAVTLLLSLLSACAFRYGGPHAGHHGAEVEHGLDDTAADDTADTSDTGAACDGITVSGPSDLGRAAFGSPLAATYTITSAHEYEGDLHVALYGAPSDASGTTDPAAVSLSGDCTPVEVVLTLSAPSTTGADPLTLAGVLYLGEDVDDPLAQVAVTATFGTDADADGSLVDEDCDDADPTVQPGVDEADGNGVDDDCDGWVDEDSSETDLDGDGYAGSEGDCDDAEPAISPAAVEIWYDGIDQDCDGDDTDQDGDGHSLAGSSGVVPDDCDDTDADAHPGAEEVWYDGDDADCSGTSDYDQDGDGVGSDAYGGTDCNDTDPTTAPTMPEIWYDAVDEDCSGGSDYDQDGDGVGASGYGGTDCDDIDARVYPGAPDPSGDGIDSDCDGVD